jgi:hypothetical protein
MRILNFENFKDHNLSEGLNYHLNKNIGLLESVYRIESDSWLDLINESRQLWLENKLDLDWDDVFLISTDAGLKSNYKGKEVLLDVPFEIESGVYEAEYKGRKVELNKTFRTAKAPRKFGVYTKNDSGKRNDKIKRIAIPRIHNKTRIIYEKRERSFINGEKRRQ